MATIRHIALFADDPGKLGDFYEHVFGLEITGRSADGDVWITDGYMDIALILRRGENAPKGLHHWGFTLDAGEKESVYEKLTAQGCAPFDPRSTRPEADRPYVEDAALDIDGNRFDLTTGMRELQTGTTKSADRPAWAPKIKHLALFTENPEKLAAFYNGIFGTSTTGVTGRGAHWISDGYVDYALLWKRNERMPKGINHFGFTIDAADKDDIYAKLTDAGREIFEPGRDRPYVEEASRDPEGNRFDLTTAMRDIDDEMARPRTKEEWQKIDAAGNV